MVESRNVVMVMYYQGAWGRELRILAGRCN